MPLLSLFEAFDLDLPPSLDLEVLLSVAEVLLDELLADLVPPPLASDPLLAEPGLLALEPLAALLLLGALDLLLAPEEEASMLVFKLPVPSPLVDAELIL